MINQENFYTAMGPTIKVAQYFGILPITGVLKQSPRLISANVFFGNAIMSLILFLRFSPKWIKLLKKWEEMENILNSFDISTGLADRYAWLNKSIKNSSRRKFQVLYWYQIRKNYAILSDLVKQTNDDLSALIFLSYYTNLYFICLQLFQGITIQRNGGLNKIYFFVSFCYLISRTIAVTISASRINVESKVVLPNIYSCPSSAFTNETKRLQHQISTDDVVLTGMNFFSITRNFMLVTAGVIVTYEVVLLQLIVTTNK
ncbi:gustatory receptor for sugar taste 64f-like [Aphidius gifuensis]|uniref:gustatory receptor for sugar taste 64f-like n=1 Tax=Aphidius gifuensis TaxID=684658 RepID=UPI001CDCB1DC|nr:gustatory receptor for sugar taste 64f-like [Aphidius gifuensis]